MRNPRLEDKMRNFGFFRNSPLFSGERHYLPLIILLLVLVEMAWMSWLKWPDIIVDFGIQIYVAWRLSEGDVLYRDIIYFMGPLSSYIHGFLFKLFGPSFLVLVTFNIFLVVCLTALIFHLFNFLGDSVSGTLSALAFLTIFAFSQYLWVGNYNFVVSYVYDLTHGIFLCFLAFPLLVKFALRGTTLQSAGLGILTGLILLTKFEVFLAWIISLTFGFILLFKVSQPHRVKFSKYFWTFMMAAALPPVAFFFYFFFHMPANKALEAILTPWAFVIGAPNLSLPFYQNIMGLSNLPANIKIMTFYFFVWAMIFAAIVFASHLSRKFFNNSIWANVLFLCLALGLFLLFRDKIPWLEAMRPLPIILFLFGIYLYATRSEYHGGPVQLSRGIVLFTVTVFSLALLTKIFFKVHVYHYGVALAMPATLIVIHILFFEAPRKISRTSPGEMLYKPAALILFLFFIISHVRVSSDFYMKKVFPVGKGSDTIIAYDPKITSRSKIFQIALDILEDKVQPREGFATFPTGTLLNYLSRRVNPLQSLGFNPVISTQIGEQTVLKSLRVHHPEYIVINFGDYRGFGSRYFGLDFGIEIYAWVQNNYVLFKQIGSDPVKDKSFGIQIFKRKPLKGLSQYMDKEI